MGSAEIVTYLAITRSVLCLSLETKAVLVVHGVLLDHAAGHVLDVPVVLQGGAAVLSHGIDYLRGQLELPIRTF